MVDTSPCVASKHGGILSPTSSYTKGGFCRGKSSTLSNLACTQGSHAKVVNYWKTMASKLLARSQRVRDSQGYPSFPGFITPWIGLVFKETVENCATVASRSLHCTLHSSLSSSKTRIKSSPNRYNAEMEARQCVGTAVERA